MLLSIFFGLLAGLLTYIVVRALFTGHDGTNIWMHYVYAIVLYSIGALLLFAKSSLSGIFLNNAFWNTVLISILGIASITLIFIIHKEINYRKKFQ